MDVVLGIHRGGRSRIGPRDMRLHHLAYGLANLQRRLRRSVSSKEEGYRRLTLVRLSLPPRLPNRTCDYHHSPIDVSGLSPHP